MSIDPMIRTRYWGLVPGSQVEADIITASERLLPFRARVEDVELHLGRWLMHHGQGFVYRATLTVTRKGGAPLSLEDESDVDAGPEACKAVIDTVFTRAAARLAKL